MNEPHKPRSIDRWLKWAAVLGPLAGVLMGAALQWHTDHIRVSQLWNWKDKQDAFDSTVVASIARLKALIHDQQP